MLRAIVTLTVSSFRASSSGEGRKSGTALTLPIGSSVYFIFLFIYFLSFPPISGANNSDFVFSVGESYSHNSTRSSPKAIISLFVITVFKILQNDTIMIQESKLRQGKRDAVFLLIQLVFSRIPLKIRSSFHRVKIRQIKIYINIFVWLFIWFFIHIEVSVISLHSFHNIKRISVMFLMLFKELHFFFCFLNN